MNKMGKFIDTDEGLYNITCLEKACYNYDKTQYIIKIDRWTYTFDKSEMGEKEFEELISDFSKFFYGESIFQLYSGVYLFNIFFA